MEYDLYYRYYGNSGFAATGPVNFVPSPVPFASMTPLFAGNNPMFAFIRICGILFIGEFIGGIFL
jgi:hypothetical protein